MRALFVAVSLLAAAHAFAEEPNAVKIAVGEERPLGVGYAPICDDPSVATLSAEGAGVLRGVKPGKTLCSLQRAGGRFVYSVTVVPAEKKPATGDGKGAGQPR
jgi:hypothetical protein